MVPYACDSYIVDVMVSPAICLYWLDDLYCRRTMTNAVREIFNVTDQTIPGRH